MRFHDGTKKYLKLVDYNAHCALEQPTLVHQEENVTERLNVVSDVH